MQLSSKGENEMRFESGLCVVRSWNPGDEDALVREANNRKIWRNLRDGFPHPYTRRDGRDFLELVAAMDPETYFCIEVKGEAAGAIGYTLSKDVERFSAEIGYWLGEEHWGRGIMTEALRAVTSHAVKAHNLSRVYAVPFDWNTPSFRVLEKAGYVREGRMRKAAYKDGQVVDELVFAFVVENWRCHE
jgi:[ribosomal protein S5]-alanine N-acetyltransferase